MCGIAGAAAINGRRDDCSSALLVRLMLEAMQYRGEEAAGIATVDGGEIRLIKGPGLVRERLTDGVVRSLRGNPAVGHTRYGTTGGSHPENAHPHHEEGRREVALVHNGNLVPYNTEDLRNQLKRAGVLLDSASDSEAIAAKIAHSDAATLEEAIVETCSQLRGAYSLAGITPQGQLFAARDPHGIRPLELGYLENGEGRFLLLASETYALDVIGAESVREIRPGEVLVIHPDGLQDSFDLCSSTDRPHRQLCIFEINYFACPATRLYGREVHGMRAEMGARLARESRDDGLQVDFVAPVPESGRPHSEGFAREMGVPLEAAFLKRRGQDRRSFLAPKGRSDVVRRKLQVLPGQVRGKRLVIVEDSVVRGTTTPLLVKGLYGVGGADWVGLGVAAPPITHPCFYGIDTATAEQLVASQAGLARIRELVPAQFRDAPPTEVIRAYIGAKWMRYLSLEEMGAATGRSLEDFCTACYTGIYPVPLEGR